LEYSGWKEGTKEEEGVSLTSKRRRIRTKTGRGSQEDRGDKGQRSNEEKRKQALTGLEEKTSPESRSSFGTPGSFEDYGKIINDYQKKIKLEELEIPPSALERPGGEVF